ncbi:hypothetical protein SAMN05892883_3390 [Jatrophihabitans sp. GAS493]|uniref:hypothetical protein n=1 Tax=Jatrophihabitans sp. GAS493 TaxID=1907575 RepID=UPI000BB73EA5|nr:hypothetical protein [Jatrophihabitans sp. GAS493]SOD74209.1 hypothetical protein SAMN05892883_3390 [Jatrophihabitans sp. GAS493]
MNLAISIKNSTTFTPYLTVVNLNNANWIDGQGLAVNQPIAAGQRIVGLLDGALPFSGAITVHYGFIPPGPNGADVQLTFDAQDFDGQPMIGFNSDVQPAGQLPNTDVHLMRDGADWVLLLEIAP